MKNAFRATVERQLHLKESSNLPPVEITISIYKPSPVQAPPPDLAPSTKVSNDLLCIRIRDYGGGIRPSDFEKIFSYAFTTVGQHEPEAAEWDEGLFGQTDGLQSGLGRIAGLGYGLPMARLYARYFGGNLELVNMHGMSGGTDAYVLFRVGPNHTLPQRE